MNGGVDHTIENNLATIVFHHPKGNSLTSHLLAKLAHTIIELGASKEVKIIIIKSLHSNTFCGGASFHELVEINNETDGMIFFSGFAKVINAMRNCPKLIIARIQGKAVGGGVGLASAADYCLAAETASVRLSELAVGIGPFVIEPAVSRRIGSQAMAILTLNPEKWQSASWAQEMGIYHEVYQTLEELDKAIVGFTSRLSKYSLEAMIEIKKMMWNGTESWDQLLIDRAQISGKLALSSQTQKILKKYRE